MNPFGFLLRWLDRRIACVAHYNPPSAGKERREHGSSHRSLSLRVQQAERAISNA